MDTQPDDTKEVVARREVPEEVYKANLRNEYVVMAFYCALLTTAAGVIGYFLFIMWSASKMP